MNLLGIDYGSKRVGLAVSIMGIISTLPPIRNDDKLFDNILKTLGQYDIKKVYVGLSQGNFALKTQSFVDDLKKMLKLDVETVEEAVSTIEADAIYKENKGKLKNYKNNIDSVAAAVILNRVV